MYFCQEDQKEIQANIHASLDTWSLSPVSEICPRHSITHGSFSFNPAVKEIRCKLSRWELKSISLTLYWNASRLQPARKSSFRAPYYLLMISQLRPGYLEVFLCYLVSVEINLSVCLKLFQNKSGVQGLNKRNSRIPQQINCTQL